MTIDLIQIGLLQGMILAIIALGIMIPFRFLDFPDLTAEGAFPLGGAIYSSVILSGYSPILAIIFAILGSGIMAIGTGLVHLKLKVNSLLAGIILSTMVYSINLRIMGKPNISLFDQVDLFSSNINLNILLLFILIFILVFKFCLFLYSDFGLRFRAIGLNKDFAAKQEISIGKYTILGLFTSGCLFGLAGCIIVQIQNYMDIGMGVGILIHGLASLMIGESVIGNNTIFRQLMAPIIGALIYQQIQGVALSSGLAPSDLKFFTGAIVLLVIGMQKRI